MSSNKKKRSKKRFLMTCDTSSFVRHMNGGKYTSEDYKLIKDIEKAYQEKK